MRRWTGWGKLEGRTPKPSSGIAAPLLRATVEERESFDMACSVGWCEGGTEGREDGVREVETGASAESPSSRRVRHGFAEASRRVGEHNFQRGSHEACVEDLVHQVHVIQEMCSADTRSRDAGVGVARRVAPLELRPSSVAQNDAD